MYGYYLDNLIDTPIFFHKNNLANCYEKHLITTQHWYTQGLNS